MAFVCFCLFLFYYSLCGGEQEVVFDRGSRIGAGLRLSAVVVISTFSAAHASHVIEKKIKARRYQNNA